VGQVVKMKQYHTGSATFVNGKSGDKYNAKYSSFSIRNLKMKKGDNKEDWRFLFLIHNF
jgi:hypothetical protein